MMIEATAAVLNTNANVHDTLDRTKAMFYKGETLYVLEKGPTVSYCLSAFKDKHFIFCVVDNAKIVEGIKVVVEVADFIAERMNLANKRPIKV